MSSPSPTAALTRRRTAGVRLLCDPGHARENRPTVEEMTLSRYAVAGALVLGALGVAVPATHGSATPARVSALSDPNWAGFFTESPNLDLEGAYARWTVPKVRCPSTGSYRSSIWVGVGGAYRTPAAAGGVEWLYQTGTDQYCTDGEEQYGAWTRSTTTTANKRRAATVCSAGPPLGPGDVMTAAVVQHSLYTTATLINVRDGHRLWRATRHSGSSTTRHAALVIRLNA